MTEKPSEVSAAELMAFVDGECDAERRRVVEAYLAETPAAAERVEIWRRQGKTLRAAFSRIENEPEPASILLPYQRRDTALAARAGAPHVVHAPAAASVRPRRPRLAGKRALFCAFAAGAVCAAAAVLVVQAVHAPAQDVSLADEPLARRAFAILADFSEARPARATAQKRPTLIAPHVPGYEVVGVRAAPGLRGEAADDPFCVFYARDKDPPAALCVAPDDGAADAAEISGDALAHVPGARLGESSYVWRQAGARYALAGYAPDGRLRELATRMSAGIAALAR